MRIITLAIVTMLIVGLLVTPAYAFGDVLEVRCPQHGTIVTRSGVPWWEPLCRPLLMRCRRHARQHRRRSVDFVFYVNGEAL